MKKRNLWYALALLLLCVVLSLAACSAAVPEDYEPTANENPFLAETGYKKPEINLDGVLDDAKWESVEDFTFGADITASVKAFYGENGIYVGAIVNDPELWAMSSNVYDNSSFEVYLDYSGKGGAKPDAEQIQIFIDVSEQSMVRRGNGGLWVDTNLIKNYAVKVNGTLGERNEDTSYGIELFIPYSQLGGETQMNYGIGFGLVGCQNSVRNVWLGVPGTDVQSPETYMVFYRDTNTIEQERKVDSSKLKVDGLNDDDAWANATVYPFGDGGRGSVSTHMADEGLYFFMDMTDAAVCAEGTTIFLNDSVEIYIDALCDGGTVPQADEVQIRADVLGGIEFLRGTGSGLWVNADNNVFTGAQEKPSGNGYTIEVFVPWSDLGLEGKPEALEVSFGSVNWDGGIRDDGSRDTSWSGIGTDPQVPDNYVRLTEQGIEGAAAPAAKAEITLDGKLEDSQWSGTPSFRYHDGAVQVQWFWTDNGCYMGFTVEDSVVRTDGSKPFENSSVELYLDYENNGGTPGEKDRTILVDAAGRMLFRKGGTENRYLDFGTNTIQSGVSLTDSGYIVELYIPWSEFGGEKPSEMGVAFGQVTRKDGEAGTAWHNDGLCTDPQNPSLYSLFTPDAIAAR